MAVKYNNQIILEGAWNYVSVHFFVQVYLYVKNSVLGKISIHFFIKMILFSKEQSIN